MIDEDFRVWLIEVNDNPYLGTPNQFCKKLVPKMLIDLFDLHINSKENFSKIKPNNQYELIHSDSVHTR